jgi:hypothetical protein
MSTNDPRNTGDTEVGPFRAAANAPVADIQGLHEVTQRYDYRLTPYLQSLLRGRPAHDPLVRQFLPNSRELHALPHERADPIGDIPGGFGKVPIGPEYLGTRALDYRQVKDVRGMSHCYPE